MPFAARDKFLHALVAELAVAGAHNPGVVRKIGQKGYTRGFWERRPSSRPRIATDRTLRAQSMCRRLLVFTGYM